MSNPPPGPPPIPPIQPPPPRHGPPLDYGRPSPGGSKNRWWMIILRIFGGILAAGASGAAGLGLANVTGVDILFLLPPFLMLAGLVFVAVKFRRFGYVTGFVIAPFLVAASLIIILLIVCGGMLRR